MRASVDLIPEHVASRIVAIQEQLASPVIYVRDRAQLMDEQTRLWDEHFPGKAYEDIATLVPCFMIAA